MKKGTILYGMACFLLGAAMFAGGAASAAGVSAERSTNAVYIDGKHVELEAYSIFGSNYVKLRDVGKAVGFNVYWDGGAVQIDSDAPYTGEAPASTKPAAAQATGGIVTLPTDGSKYVPQVGDVIRCDDGTLYTITDTLRWENNVLCPLRYILPIGKNDQVQKLTALI